MQPTLLALKSKCTSTLPHIAGMDLHSQTTHHPWHNGNQDGRHCQDLICVCAHTPWTSDLAGCPSKMITVSLGTCVLCSLIHIYPYLKLYWKVSGSIPHCFRVTYRWIDDTNQIAQRYRNACIAQKGTFLHSQSAYELPVVTDNSLLPARGLIGQVSWSIQKGSKDWLLLTVLISW